MLFLRPLSKLARLSIFMLICATLVGCSAMPTKESDTMTNITQLTTGFTKAGEAYFSDDARWIIFQAEPPGETGYAMYVAPTRLDGRRIAGLGSPVRISPPGSRNTCGFFSPDGVSIIFGSSSAAAEGSAPGYQRQTGKYMWSFERGMEIYRADGWESAVAVVERGKGVDLAKFPITKNDAYDAECGFSPDGKWIVFASNRIDSAEQSPDVDLFVMRSDGTNPVRLTNTPGYDGGPFFSPNGRQIVFRSDRKGDSNLQVYIADLVFDANGNITGMENELALTSDANVNWGPFFHPSGDYVIYATSAQGHDNYELYMSRTDAYKRCRLTFTPKFDGLPAFSRDGRHLMWTSKRTADNTTQLFLAEFKVPGYLKAGPPFDYRPGTENR
jgi:TolB protein